MLRVADLELDPITQKAMRSGRAIELTATEYALLELLMLHAGTVVPSAAIIASVGMRVRRGKQAEWMRPS